MKKLIFVLLSFIALGFSACVTVDPEPVINVTDPLRPSDGGLDLKFADATMEATSQTTASVSDEVIATLIIKKSANGGKPRKLAIYVSDTETTQGILFLDNIKLKNIDEQTQTVNYSLPASTTTTKYLHFEVLNNNEKYTRRTLRVTIVAPGQLAINKSITLGANNNNLPSRMNSATGFLYTACDVDSNLNFIDLTYGVVPNSSPLEHVLISNLFRADKGFALSPSKASCLDENGAITIIPFTGGGKATYFAATTLTKADFDAATDASLQALTVSSANPQFVVVENDKVYSFLNSRGKKGLVFIRSLVTSTTGSLNFDVVVQK